MLPFISELEKQLRMAHSDPFIPENIRNLLLVLLKRRVAALRSVYEKELNVYAADLAKGKPLPCDDEMKGEHLRNMIIDGLDGTDCYIEQFAQEVAEIRKMIQDYFRAFDPHGGGRPRSRAQV